MCKALLFPVKHVSLHSSVASAVYFCGCRAYAIDKFSVQTQRRPVCWWAVPPFMFMQWDHLKLSFKLMKFGHFFIDFIDKTMLVKKNLYNCIQFLCFFCFCFTYISTFTFYLRFNMLLVLRLSSAQKLKQIDLLILGEWLDCECDQAVLDKRGFLSV